MLRRLILFLVRKKLRLKKYDMFKFANQKTNSVYFFSKDKVMKTEHGITYPSSVSLNWLLDDECEIERIKVI